LIWTIIKVTWWLSCIL